MTSLAYVKFSLDSNTVSLVVLGRVVARKNIASLRELEPAVRKLIREGIKWLDREYDRCIADPECYGFRREAISTCLYMLRKWLQNR